MQTFADFLDTIENEDHRKRTHEVLAWVSATFPTLDTRIAWNCPHFTQEGTFIVAISVAKKHLAVAPEKAALDEFSEKITAAGYEHTTMLIRFPWNQSIDFDLLQDIIAYNIKDKKGIKTYWRPAEKS